jgi:hypothetical protein
MENRILKQTGDKKMDKHRRLTKWNEWEIGADYLWKKGGSFGRFKITSEPWQCVAVNQKQGHVLFSRNAECLGKILQFNWQGRFIKVAGTNSENDKTLADKEI